MDNSQTENKLYVVQAGGHDFVMKEMTREEFCGMSCLSGIFYDRKKKAYARDKVIRIPCERVENIIEFDSVEDYHTAIELYYAEQAV